MSQGKFQFVGILLVLRFEKSRYFKKKEIHMLDTKDTNLITINKAAQFLGIKIEVIQYQIDAGKIEPTDGMVHESIDRKSTRLNSSH